MGEGPGEDRILSCEERQGRRVNPPPGTGKSITVLEDLTRSGPRPGEFTIC